MSFCGKCGFENLANKKFCTKCGQPFAHSTSQSAKWADKVYAVQQPSKVEKEVSLPHSIRTYDELNIGIVLSAILLISPLLPWSSQVNEYDPSASISNIGLKYSWGVVVIILAFVQLVAYIYTRTLKLEPAMKFRLDFVHAVTGVIAVIGVAISQKENSNLMVKTGVGLIVTGIAAFAAVVFAIVRMVELRKSGVDLKLRSSAQIMAEKVTEAVQSQASQVSKVASIADELRKLSDLREQGIITDEQFETLRNKLLADQ